MEVRLYFIIHFSQNLFDIGFSYKGCNFTPVVKAERRVNIGKLFCMCNAKNDYGTIEFIPTHCSGENFSLATYNPGERTYFWTLRELRYWQIYAGYLTVLEHVVFKFHASVCVCRDIEHAGSLENTKEA